MARRQIRQLKIFSLGQLGKLFAGQKIYGGAGIRDPSKMNLALGAKILWRIISDERAWWKEIMQKIYMNGTRKRCMDKINLDRKGSLIWELCKKDAYILNEHLYWTLGNGKEIKIWKDKCGNASLANFLQAFLELKQRLDTMKIYSLHDLSVWTDNGIWVGWIDLEIWDQPRIDYQALISLLQGQLLSIVS